MRMRASVMLAAGLLSACAFASAEENGCLVEVPRPADGVIAARKKKAADLEATATRTIREVKAGMHLLEGDRKQAAAERVRAVEEALPHLREIQKREYCRTDAAGANPFVEEVFNRIEECGTRNFPKLNGKSVYGAVEVEFVLNASGELVFAKVLKGANGAVLREHALALVRASAPFGQVPASLTERRFDRFIVRSRFSFDQEQQTKVKEPATRCRL